MENVLAFKSQQELLLSGEHFGAVEGEQLLSLGDLLAREVDEDLIDPPVYTRMDADDTRFVQGHFSHRANRPLARGLLHLSVTYAGQLLLFRADPDGSHRRFGHGLNVLDLIGGVLIDL